MSEGEVSASRSVFLGSRLFSLAVQALLPVLLLVAVVVASEDYRAGLIDSPEGRIMIQVAGILVALGVLMNLIDIWMGKPPHQTSKGVLSYHASRLEIAAFTLCFLPAMAVILLGPQFFLLVNSLLDFETELGALPAPARLLA